MIRGVLAAVTTLPLLAGACNSTPMVAADDSNKLWTVTHPSPGGGAAVSASPMAAAGNRAFDAGSAVPAGAVRRESFARPAGLQEGPRVQAVPVGQVDKMLLDSGPRPPAAAAAPPGPARFAEAHATADLERISGKLRAVEGGIVDLGGELFRLAGIRPPGPEDRCGAALCSAEARRWLAERAEGKVVHCERTGPAVVCSLDGQDLGLGLVKAGLAQAAGGPGYPQAEQEARRAQVGRWAESR
ncbi:MAG: hypothetical protein H7841_13620 [Magnetospirillum sp. WYHS-4]